MKRCGVKRCGVKRCRVKKCGVKRCGVKRRRHGKEENYLGNYKTSKDKN